jgi:hypothetical protein
VSLTAGDVVAGGVVVVVDAMVVVVVDVVDVVEVVPASPSSAMAATGRSRARDIATLTSVVRRAIPMWCAMRSASANGADD